MSITVIIARGDTGAPTTREVYAEGVKFNIENGELGIISDRPQLVALYGSGNWLSVHVDDHVVVVTEKPDEDSDSSGDLDFSSFGDSEDASSDAEDASSDAEDASSDAEDATSDAEVASSDDSSTDSDGASDAADSTDEATAESSSTE